MSKPTNKSINYLRLAIVVAIIAGIIGGFIVWMLLSAAKQEIYVPIVAETAGQGKGKLEKGDIIDVSDLDSTSVGRYGLSENIVTDPNVLVGRYVNRDYQAGEYFWNFNILDDYPKTLAERVRYSAVPVPINLITSVNADIQEDDFVKVSIIESKDEKDTNTYETTDITGKLPDSGVTIIEAEELQAVRVVGFYDSAGADITAVKRSNNMSKDKSTYQNINPSFIVFDANPIQQALLLQGVYGGKIQLIIIPEEQQLEKKREWGLIDDENNKVESPIFVDDSLELEQKQQALKDKVNASKDAENEKIDQAIDSINNGEVNVTEDPNLASSYPPGVEPDSISQPAQSSGLDVVDLE